MTRSYLGKHIGKPATSSEELHKMAADAWRERHTLVVKLNDPAITLSQMDRAYLETVGNKIYGTRGKHGV
jgi:hypothetical protein